MLHFVVSDLVPALNGVQGVAGSNPAVPTQRDPAEYHYWLGLVLWPRIR